MKCSNCNSPMFVSGETATAKSQVTFFRCSICVSEHVSSEPVNETHPNDQFDYFTSTNSNNKSGLFV
ncbi:MAG: hypothetical protein ACI87H_002030 [Gammaproteobacteria bacterium]|jgi:hypothetical protein